MKFRRWIGLMTSILLAGSMVGCDYSFESIKGKEEPIVEEAISYVSMDQWMDYYTPKLEEKEVVCWYTEESDKQWLEGAADAFKQKYGVDVSLVYYDGVSMFEDMNQANQNGKGPDLYLAGNDQLELAVTAALTEENEGVDEFWKTNYPEVAQNASTYKGKKYGYPIYFDTYCLVYDANLLENAPASMDDILAFADAYEDTGATKAIFRWDVADPYINTMFLNCYSDLFGENGDEASSFMVNSEKAVEAMEYFKSLSAYLWMNKNNISHDTVKNRIQDGSLVLGLCKTDILETLYNEKQSTTEQTSESDAEENTEDVTNYQIAYVPSLTEELASEAFSTTYSAHINPYGANEIGAKMFGLYLSLGQGAKQYEGNKKLPVVNQNDGFDEMQTIFYAQYLNSKPVPKVMILGDYLAESGIVFDAIWEGADVKEKLDQLQKTMDEKIAK